MQSFCNGNESFESPSFPGQLTHGADDVFITRTPADVPRKSLPDFLIALKTMMAQHICDRHDETGRAEPALQTVMITESLLNSPQILDASLSFDGFNVHAIRLNRERQTGSRAPAIQQNRTRTANAMLATDMRSSQSEFMTQKVG